jgi:hypothetical protein
VTTRRSQTTGATPLASEARQLRADMHRSVGQPLDEALRSEMESRSWSAPGPQRDYRNPGSGYRGLELHADATAGAAYAPDARANGHENPGVDFSRVRLHADAHARSALRSLGAQAFTVGEHVYADPAMLAAPRAARDNLLTHELAHVVQQRQIGRAFIQPKLIATGTDADVQRFFALAQAAMGEQLQRDPVTNEITAVASLPNPATSPVFAAAMHRIMDNPTQNAEANFGTGQAGVAVGAFPIPSDLTGPTQQLIDMDDDWVVDLRDAVAVYRDYSGNLRMDQSYQMTTGEGAALGGVPELARINAITTATAATTLPIIAQKSVRPRRISPPRRSYLSLGNVASSLSGSTGTLRCCQQGALAELHRRARSMERAPSFASAPYNGEPDIACLEAGHRLWHLAEPVLRSQCRSSAWLTGRVAERQLTLTLGEAAQSE